MTQLPPPGQPPYGAPNPYGAPSYGFGPPEHPQATVVLVLGIVSIVACGLVGPVAWVMGNRVVREIDASNGQVGGRSLANAGRICGMVVTLLLGVFLVLGVLIVILALVGVLHGST